MSFKLDETTNTNTNSNNKKNIYENELNLNNKNKEINKLQKELNALIQNKNIKNNTSINNGNYNDMIININNNDLPYKPFNNISFQNNISQNHLLELIQILKQENTILKSKLSIEQKIEDKYSDTIQYKFLSAKKEVENLKKMNTNKDNIIMNLQNFINNINKIISNGKINLNINQVNPKEFLVNLKELETKIISNLQKNKNGKIPQPKINKGKINILKKQKYEQDFLIKGKYMHKIPQKKITTNANFNNLSFSKNKKNDFNNFYKNKNECDDIRCGTCRKKSKKNEKFYMERKKLRLKGFLLTKPEGIFSKTRKKERIKCHNDKYYQEYLQNITKEYSSICNDENSFFFNK
jgi:hypothetical protein